MKLSKIILLSTLVFSCFAQEGATTPAIEGGSCKNGCISCRTNGEIEWCLACKGTKHEISNAINGKCLDEKNGIDNCEISAKSNGNQVCLMCKKGFGLVMEYKEAADTAKNYNERTGYTCREIEITQKNTVSGYWFKDTSLTTPTEYFFATGCDYGYGKMDLSGTKGTVCTITKSRYAIYDENCVSYDETCQGCKNALVWKDSKCRKPVLNAGAISLTTTAPFSKKWSENCRLDQDNIFYVGEVKGYYFVDDTTSFGEGFYIPDDNTLGSRGEGFYISDSNTPAFLYTGSNACINCFTNCVSDNNGNLGDSFRKLITGCLVFVFYFLLK